MISMQASVRPYASEDIGAIVSLSLRAWAPVFASLRNAIGGQLFELLRGDWHEGQAADVRRVIDDQAVSVWVAEVDAQVVGFIGATVPADSEIGEIVMVAVDPDCQGAGVGSLLTECYVRAARAWRWSRPEVTRVISRPAAPTRRPGSRRSPSRGTSRSLNPRGPNRTRRPLPDPTRQTNVSSCPGRTLRRDGQPGQVNRDRPAGLPDIAVFKSPGVGQCAVAGAVKQPRRGQLVR
jgi:GNAT superfamily N-acetyltransferase